MWYVLNVCTVVASNTAVSDPAGARRLGQASTGISVVGVIVGVIVIILIFAVDWSNYTGASSSSYSYSNYCSYTYRGTCYRYRSYAGTYDYCSGVKDYSNDYCYYD